jgi:hypothetical protein
MTAPAPAPGTITPVEKLELRLRTLKPGSVATVMLVVGKNGAIVGYTVITEQRLEVMAEA